MTNTITTLFAAWLLLGAGSLLAHQQQLGLSRRMVLASLRGLLQLLALAFVLHWIFDIQHRLVQAALIAAFCLIAAITSSEHHPQRKRAWIAASVGLLAGCAVTLPWLALTGAISNDTRSLIPLGSMIAANGMNAISIMFERMQDGDAKAAIRTALIPPIDTLRVVGLVHMPGIFVGM
ncbi:MAG: ABC transporter permease, partial [Mariprofundales bacterium]|nr:ABC transporter permease [Mariprofundales bacterium]